MFGEHHILGYGVWKALLLGRRELSFGKLGISEGLCGTPEYMVQDVFGSSDLCLSPSQDDGFNSAASWILIVALM